MNFISLLAHSESFHNEGTSTFVHVITQAYIALPLYVGLHVVLYYLLKKNHKKAMIPLFMALNLLVGILTYSAVPAISVLAISAGIIGALAISFVLIAGS